MLMHIREENENQCMRNWLQITLISNQLSNKWDSFVITTVSVTVVITLKSPGFETYHRRVVSLSKTLYSPKVLVNYPGSDGSVPT